MKSYSQYNQDIILYNNFFKDLNKGFFVDIGAHDGVSLSNTKLFEDLGWEGVCIEPQLNEFKKLKENRNCKVINGVISDKKQKQVEFCKITGDCNMLSGIVDYYDEEHKRRILSELKETNGVKEKILIDNYNFNDIIEETNINLLCIDTEGGEEKILNSIDFEKYNIDVIIFEDNYRTLIKNLKSDILNNYKISKKYIGPDVVLKRIK